MKCRDSQNVSTYDIGDIDDWWPLAVSNVGSELFWICHEFHGFFYQQSVLFGAGTMNVASSAPPTMEGQCRQGCSKATPYLRHCFQSLVVFGDGDLQHFESNDSWLSLFPGRCPVRQEMFMLRFLDCTSIGRDLIVSHIILDSLRMDQAKCVTRLDVTN